MKNQKSALEYIAHAYRLSRLGARDLRGGGVTIREVLSALNISRDSPNSVQRAEAEEMALQVLRTF